MDERAPSPAFPHSPLPLSTFTLKIERGIDSPEPDEYNPLEQEDALEPEKEFILTFESLQLLWDPKNLHYTNRFKRNKALAKLLPILRKIKPAATIQEVKNKINSIRSNYRRELRKVLASQRSESDPNDVYRPKIWYFPYLHFLRKLEQRNSHSLNEPPIEEGSSQQLNEVSQAEPQFSSVIIPESKPLPRVRKRSILGQLLEAPRQSIPKLGTELSPPKTVSNHIVLEWAEILDKLDPMQRLYAKKAINDVLFEAELGNLRKNSVRINEPVSNYPSTSSPAHSSTVKLSQSPSSP